MAREPVEFSVSVVGESSGEKWFGKFKAKIALSHREELVRDRRRRELLGGESPERASQRALTQAEVFSLLFVALVDAPKWWIESDGGLDLQDDNVIVEVYENVMRIQEDAATKLQKEAEEAREVIKKIDPTKD